MKYQTETRLFWTPKLFEEPLVIVTGFKKVCADDVPEEVLKALAETSTAKQIQDENNN